MFINESMLRSLIKRRLMIEGIDKEKIDLAIELVDVISDYLNEKRDSPDIDDILYSLGLEDVIKQKIHSIVVLLNQLANSEQGLCENTILKSQGIKSDIISISKILYESLTMTIVDDEKYSIIINDKYFKTTFINEMIHLLVGMLKEFTFELAFGIVYNDNANDNAIQIIDGSTNEVIHSTNEWYDNGPNSSAILIKAKRDMTEDINGTFVDRMIIWLTEFSNHEKETIVEKLF